MQGSYIPESTENLIRRAEQALGEIPVLDLTNWHTLQMQPPVQAQHVIKSLSPSCHSITVKNVINVTDSSIIVCSGSSTGTCGSIPLSCPTGPLSPNDYVNMVATLTAQVDQSGIEVTFKYLLNNTPTSITVPANVTAAGPNIVYAFPANIQYTPDTTLVLYGAEVTKY